MHWIQNLYTTAYITSGFIDYINKNDYACFWVHMHQMLSPPKTGSQSYKHNTSSLFVL